MKKLSAVFITTSLIVLSGCATPTGTGNPNTTANTINTGLNIGKTVFQTAVNNRCRSELTNNQLWQASRVVFTQAKQEQIQTSICGCVSTKSVENVTAAELITAAADQNARNQMVVTAVANSLNSCYGQIMQTLTTN